MTSKLNVVKRAETLNVDELKLGKKAYDVVKGLPPKELVFLARTNNLLSIEGLDKKTSKEIMAALDTAGFIRHDISRDFKINCLRREIVDDKKFICAYSDFEDNEEYENYSVLPSFLVEKMTNSIMKMFFTQKEEWMLLLYYFCESHLDIVKFAHCFGERVFSKNEKRALRKRYKEKMSRAIMRMRECYPVKMETQHSVGDIIAFGVYSEKEYYEYKETLEKELHRRRAQEELSIEKELSKVPNEIRNLPVCEIGLSTRTTNVLKRGYLETLGEVIEQYLREPEYFRKIRNCGPVCIRELEAKISEFGYEMHIN